MQTLKLHLGCGKRFFPGWKHFDIGDYDHLDGHNISDLPYPDNSVDVIYSSHVIEYFDRDEVILLLQEWFRVLKPGGIVRLAVPDFDAMSRLYFLEMVPLERFLGPLYGKMQPEGCDPIYHKTTYNFQHLSSVLESVGFQDVRRYDWRETEHAEFDDHSQAYIPHMDKENGVLISLNVEATKTCPT